MAAEDGDNSFSASANVAGYWTVGVLQGVAIVAVPIAAISLSYGLITRVIDFGATFWRKD
jgi:hypothetical protein